MIYDIEMLQPIRPYIGNASENSNGKKAISEELHQNLVYGIKLLIENNFLYLMIL